MTDETTTDEAVEATEPDGIPTLAEVRREESKVRELRERFDPLPDEIEQADAEIAQAISTGAPEDDVRTLRANRRELVELQADLEAAHEVLTARARERREAATREMARKRLKAIEDEVVVGASLLDEDLARLIEAAHVYAEVAGEIEERYAGLVTLDAEAGKLGARWPNLDRPDLPTVIPPGRTDAAKAARTTVAKVTLAARPPRRVSIEGTEGGEIIAEAGETRPDFVLSDDELAERRAAEKRAAEKERREAEQEERNRRALAEVDGGHRVEPTRVF